MPTPQQNAETTDRHGPATITPTDVREAGAGRSRLMAGKEEEEEEQRVGKQRGSRRREKRVAVGDDVWDCARKRCCSSFTRPNAQDFHAMSGVE
jgi:hypothetical protein